MRLEGPARTSCLVGNGASLKEVLSKEVREQML